MFIQHPDWAKKTENKICQRKSLQHPIRLLGPAPTQNLSTSDQIPIFWIFALLCLQYYHPIQSEPKNPDPERAHLQPFPMGRVVNNNQFLEHVVTSISLWEIARGSFAQHLMLMYLPAQSLQFCRVGHFHHWTSTPNTSCSSYFELLVDLYLNDVWLTDQWT